MILTVILLGLFVIQACEIVLLHKKLSASQDRLAEVDEYAIALQQSLRGYGELKEDYTQLEENVRIRAVLDPLKDLLSPNEIHELIKEIPRGSPLRVPFSVTAHFGESIGFHGRLRDDHTGIDIVSDTDDWMITPIGDGEVVHHGMDEVFGKVIYVRHSDRVRSMYAHGEKIYYAGITGELVTSDTGIMWMGSTGFSDGIHLHFQIEVYSGEQWIPIDPYPFIRE